MTQINADFFEGCAASNGEVGGKMDGFARARHDVGMPDDADMPVGRGREGLPADDADDADFLRGVVPRMAKSVERWMASQGLAMTWVCRMTRICRWGGEEKGYPQMTQMTQMTQIFLRGALPRMATLLERWMASQGLAMTRICRMARTCRWGGEEKGYPQMTQMTQIF